MNEKTIMTVKEIFAEKITIAFHVNGYDYHIPLPDEKFVVLSVLRDKIRDIREEEPPMIDEGTYSEWQEGYHAAIDIIQQWLDEKDKEGKE